MFWQTTQLTNIRAQMDRVEATARVGTGHIVAKAQETLESRSGVEISAFQLSRIYGQGWSAARKLLADGGSDVDEALAATLNPHGTVEEREHWARGFKEALGSRGRPFNPRGGRSWRPTIEE